MTNQSASPKYDIFIYFPESQMDCIRKMVEQIEELQSQKFQPQKFLPGTPEWEQYQNKFVNPKDKCKKKVP